jgi:hypothetical protein
MALCSDRFDAVFHVELPLKTRSPTMAAMAQAILGEERYRFRSESELLT